MQTLSICWFAFLQTALEVLCKQGVSELPLPFETESPNCRAGCSVESLLLLTFELESRNCSAAAKMFWTPYVWHWSKLAQKKKMNK